MRTRNLLTSVAAATIIVATAALYAPDALAQKSAVLSPRTGWAVTNVADDSAGSGAYCAMARRFTDNLIMTLAKNGQNEMSFALDFPKGDFDSEKNLAVILDPGAGQQRSYEVRPASKKAFVVRLGHDQPFMEALQRTGYLRAEVAGATYNFNLSDIDKGNAKLEACLIGGAEPEVPKSATAAITPFPGEMGGGSPVDVGNSRHELEALRKENMALNTQMQALGASGTASPETQQQLEVLRNENEKLAAIVAASASSDGSAAGVMQGLAAENQRLQAALNEKASATGNGAEELSGKEQAIKDLTERLHILEQENLELTEQVKRAGETDSSPSDEAVLKKLMEENRGLKDKLSAVEIDAALGEENNGRVALLEHTIERLKSKNDTLAEQVGALTVAMDSGGGMGRGSVGEMQSKNEILARQVRSLTKALGSGGSGRDAAQVDDLRKQVAELEIQNRMLQDSLSGVETSAGGDAEIEVLKASNERLQVSLGIEKDLKHSHKAAAGRLENQIEAIGSENDALKEEISKARAEAQTLNLSLERTREEKASLQQKADAATLGEYELTELRAKHDALKNDSASLAAELDIIRSKNEEIEGTQQKEIGALKKSNAEMRAALDAAKEDAASRAVRYEVADTEIESLKTENDALKAEVLEMALRADDGDALQVQVRSLMTENERLGRDVATREAELQQEILSLNEIVQNLQQQNESFGSFPPVASTDNSAVIEKLTAENTRLQAELAINAKYHEVGKEDVTALEKQIDELHEANETLTASLATLTEEADSYQVLIQEQQDEIAELKQDNEGLLQQVETLKAEAMAAVDLVSTEQKKIIEENRQLKGRLKDFIHKAALEKEEALRSLISENSRLREQLHKASSAGRIIPVTYRPPLAPRKPDISLLRPAGGKSDRLSQAKAAQREAEEMQKVTPAAGDDESAGPAPVQGPPQQQAIMNEAQRAEEVMKNALEEPQPEPVVAAEPVAQEPAALPTVAQQPPEPLQTETVPAAMPAAASVAPPSQKPHRPMPGVQDILKSAGVEMVGQVQLVEAASKEGLVVYQWNAGNLYGSAEQRQTSGTGNFDSFAQDYIAKTKTRCPGDFAAMTDGAARQDGIRIDSYEIACVGGQVSSTATLLFFERAGVFTVMAHETDTANMDEAMEVRDRLIRAISGTAI